MAKKLRDEDLNLNIIVNGDKGKKELGDLEKSTRELTARNKELRIEKEKLIRAGKQETDEFKAVNKEITENNRVLKTNETRMTELRKEIGLTGLTMRQLRSEQTRLKRLMDSATPGTEQWKLYRTQLDKVESQMGKVRNGGERMHMSLGKMADGFNRYFAMASVWIASLTGVVLGFKKASNAFAEFDDQVADVRKTTGLTKDEVLELDKTLEKIDTRSSQEELLGLARVAGKLGITGVEDIEGFVRAADQIKVALTEDLGGDVEQSVNEIGKLTDIFGLEKEFGIERSIVKVGSAINSLGAASTANEGYIVEFTKRVAGIAPSAGISIDKVLGLAATLDQFGQTSEVASTVISQVLPDMFKDTATYAGIAKMSVTDFKDLLNKDANEAMIRFLQGLNGNNGGLAEMTAKLDGLGLEGKRSISVLGVLANNTNTLREQQALSAKEFEKGTSLLNEFNIKNETMQARLDKSKDDLARITVELGQNLSPALLVSTSGVTYFIRALSAGFRIFNQYYPVIISATAAVIAYTIALKLNTIEKRAAFLTTKLGTAIEASYAAVKALVTGKIKLATIAQRAWNAAVASNPIGAILAVVIAVGAAIWQYSKNTNQAAAARKALNDVELTSLQNTIEQKVQLEHLLRIAKDEKRSLDERKAALDELNKISPEYFGNLKLETINTEAAKKATDDYIKSIEQKARVQAAQEMLVDLEKDRIKAVKEGTDVEVKWYQTLWNATKSFGNMAVFANNQATSSVKNLTKAEKDYLDVKNTLTAIIDKGNKPGAETPIGTRKTIGDQVLEWDGKVWKLVQNVDGGGGSGSPDGTVSNALDVAHASELLRLKQYYADKEQLEKEYKARLLASELAYLRIKESLEPDQLKKIELQSQIIDKQKEYTAALKDALPELMKTHDGTEGLNAKLLEETKLLSSAAKKQAQAGDELEKMAEKQKGLAEMYSGTIGQISEGIYEMTSGTEDAFKSFAKNILIFALEQLKLQAEIAIAGTTIQGLASLNPAMMFVAAAKIVAIEAVFAGIEGLVNNAFTSDKKSKTKGYASGGYALEETYRVAEQGPEFIASNPAVRNPEVKQFLDIFDYYQRTGQISKLNTKMILANLPVQQMYVGGYSNSPSTRYAAQGTLLPERAAVDGSDPALTAAINLNTQAIALLMKNGVSFPMVAGIKKMKDLDDLLSQTGMGGFKKQ